MIRRWWWCRRLGHDWLDAGEWVHQTCMRCGASEGDDDLSVLEPEEGDLEPLAPVARGCFTP